MKYIDKKSEPTEFTDWKASWSDVVPGWNEFTGKPIKQTVKAALIEEQGGLCCFCESRVGMDHGHIAHLRAQSKDADAVLVYDNLLYSCPENPKIMPQTCGQAQGDKTPEVTPLDADCEWRFIYTETGAIAPRDENDTQAIRTIRLLNLDDRKAVFRKDRAHAYQSVEQARRELTPDDFAKWIDVELKCQSDGTFKPFWTTIKFAAGLYT